MNLFEIFGVVRKYFFKHNTDYNHRKSEISPGYSAYTTEYDKIAFSNDLDKNIVKNGWFIFNEDIMEMRLHRRRFKREIEGIRSIVLASSHCITGNANLERRGNRKNGVVLTVLVDHSGSMRGHKIVSAALFCAALAPVLLQYSIRVEILGFTTSSWKGGRSRKLWAIHGKPPFPGRLCDLLHVIHRAADSDANWNDDDVRGMFAPSLLKENVDGEALMWAERRLLENSAQQKHLLVLSDGAPVDDSTLFANTLEDGKYPILSDHLCAQVKRIRNEGKIRLSAIGLGYDVSRYYGSKHCIGGLDEVAPMVLKTLSDVLEAPQIDDGAAGGKHEA